MAQDKVTSSAKAKEIPLTTKPVKRTSLSVTRSDRVSKPPSYVKDFKLPSGIVYELEHSLMNYMLRTFGLIHITFACSSCCIKFTLLSLEQGRV